MEKSPLPAIVISVRSALYALVTGGIKPDTLWRALLCVTFVASAIIGAMAYFSYQWASTATTPMMTKKSTDTALSVDEIRALTNHYTKKKRAYQELLVTRPDAPSFSKNTGVDASTVNLAIPRGVIEVGGSTTTSVITTNPSTTTTPTGTTP